jgi:mRNA-degrading endonuclease RelE of RelBE toxin-antitoxin system
MRFRIALAESALDDLRWFTKHERVLILDGIERQLRHDPLLETRNRKELRENILSRWELRLGKYRVFYNVNVPEGMVDVTAVGYKEHNMLLIRGKAVQL